MKLRKAKFVFLFIYFWGLATVGSPPPSRVCHYRHRKRSFYWLFWTTFFLRFFCCRCLFRQVSKIFLFHSFYNFGDSSGDGFDRRRKVVFWVSFFCLIHFHEKCFNNFEILAYKLQSLGQWFLTGMPWHTRVPRTKKYWETYL